MVKLNGRIADLAGRRYGRLTVLSYTGTNTKKHNARWFCQCDCGTKCVVSNKSLGEGTKSCGCLQREHVAAQSTHGETKGGTVTSEYRIFKNMHQRCANPNNPSWKDYGGRGIKVCERWTYGEDGKSAYECFLADMRRKPTQWHSIDRIEVNGNYEPDNCKWATRKEQNDNRRRFGRIETFTDAELFAELQRRQALQVTTAEGI